MTGPSIEVTTSEGFVPSDRLRAALSDLASTASAASASASDDAEVEGFGSRLTVGDVGFKATTAPKASGWNDGCWGYSLDDDGFSCGWFQYEGDSCVVYRVS